ncbi:MULTISPECIES: SH3 domain-containing protein [unclassified Exiguobacterium]|uniref:SH3 domain-containing protein n=1 Tax=unclassified Exiguobacterium TaxID=2644629 RepID=UPI001BED2DB0|nr:MULTISPECIES: SH3 domain-containing protein [unclassified Exiguobacterium]
MRHLIKASISFGLIGCLVLSPNGFVPSLDLTVQAKSSSVTATTERVTTEYTKVYASRSKQAKLVFPLTFGTTVYQNATSGSWTKITYKGRTGWVPSDALMPAVPSSTDTHLVKQTTSLFSTWSTKGKQITMVRFGDSAVKTGEYGKWSRVRVGGKTGWLPSKYISTPPSNKQISRTVYGSHTYGVDTQAEYDAVYKRVKAEFDAKYDSPEFGLNEYVYRVLDGERGTKDRNDPSFRSRDNAGLLSAEMSLEHVFRGDISFKTYEKMNRVHRFYIYLSSKYEADAVVGDDRVKSAYDDLFRRKTDCDAGAQVKSLVYDLAGIDNAIIGDGVTHAVILYQVEEGWIELDTPYTKQDIDFVNASNVYLSYTQRGETIAY